MILRRKSWQDEAFIAMSVPFRRIDGMSTNYQGDLEPSRTKPGKITTNDLQHEFNKVTHVNDISTTLDKFRNKRRTYFCNMG